MNRICTLSRNGIFVFLNGSRSIWSLLLSTLAQVKAITEQDVVADIEETLANLEEKTETGRSETSLRSVEKIMLRVTGTGMIALSRNEIFAQSQTIFQNDDLEEEISEQDADSRSQYVPTVGLDEQLFTVPPSYFLQV